MILAVVTIPIHAIVLRQSPEPRATPHVTPSSSPADALRSRPFWLLTAAFFLATMIGIAMTVLAVPYAHRDAAQARAALLVCVHIVRCVHGLDVMDVMDVMDAMDDLDVATDRLAAADPESGRTPPCRSRPSTALFKRGRGTRRGALPPHLRRPGTGVHAGPWRRAVVEPGFSMREACQMS